MKLKRNAPFSIKNNLLLARLLHRRGTLSVAVHIQPHGFSSHVPHMLPLWQSDSQLFSVPPTSPLISTVTSPYLSSCIFDYLFICVCPHNCLPPSTFWYDFTVSNISTFVFKPLFTSTQSPCLSASLSLSLWPLSQSVKFWWEAT